METNMHVRFEMRSPPAQRHMKTAIAQGSVQASRLLSGGRHPKIVCEKSQTSRTRIFTRLCSCVASAFGVSIRRRRSSGRRSQSVVRHAAGRKHLQLVQAIDHIHGCKDLSREGFLSLLEEIQQEGHIDQPVKGARLIQHAVRSRDFRFVLDLVKVGSALDHQNVRLTPLYEALAWKPFNVADRAEAIKYLLMLGADPNVLIADPSEEQFLDEHFNPDLAIKYWFAVARSPCVRAFMHAESTQRRRNTANHEKVGMRGLAYLPELFFAIVGQHVATSRLVQKVLAWASDLADGRSPLVLMFAGPSGHGKTELAEKLASLLDTSFLKVDCSQMQTATEIFGLGGAYQGADAGSELNNFISNHDGETAVVLLDELDKTRREVWDSLLNIWSRGEWTDKKLAESGQSRKVNCKGTVWILTTNVFDEDISRFWASENAPHLGKPNFDEESQRIADELEGVVRPSMANRFLPHFAGRVDAIIPFVPFSDASPAKAPVIECEVNVLIRNFLHQELDKLEHSEKNTAGVSLSVSVVAEDLDVFCGIVQHDYSAQNKEGCRAVRRLVKRGGTEKVYFNWYSRKIPAVGAPELALRAEPKKKRISLQIPPTPRFYIARVARVLKSHSMLNLVCSGKPVRLSRSQVGPAQLNAGDWIAFERLGEDLSRPEVVGSAWTLCCRNAADKTPDFGLYRGTARVQGGKLIGVDDAHSIHNLFEQKVYVGSLETGVWENGDRIAFNVDPNNKGRPVLVHPVWRECN